MKTSTRINASLLILAALAALSLACSRPKPGQFKDPNEAMQAVATLAGTGDAAKADEIFGPNSMDMLKSGDDVADKEDAERVKAAIAEKLAFEEPDADTRIALIGNDGWPFPIPIVKDGKYWRFDSEAGREEIANRRVGRNELDTIASLHAFVDAQREYFAGTWDEQPPQYARRIISTDGMHDGLYWPYVEGEPESPFGEDVAAAASEQGYDITGGAEAQAFHGYYFRILESQGAAAPGGARAYVDEAGIMNKGYAAIAWPAKHGNSGIMTFMVNHNGIVFQKDLGADTEAAAKAITSFDPDDTWTPTWDPGDEAAAPSGG